MINGVCVCVKEGAGQRERGRGGALSKEFT